MMGRGGGGRGYCAGLYITCRQDRGLCTGVCVRWFFRGRCFHKGEVERLVPIQNKGGVFGNMLVEREPSENTLMFVFGSITIAIHRGENYQYDNAEIKTTAHLHGISQTLFQIWAKV